MEQHVTALFSMDHLGISTELSMEGNTSLFDTLTLVTWDALLCNMTGVFM
jgi:hypothetical protein